jgi:hypothetical protein
MAGAKIVRDQLDRLDAGGAARKGGAHDYISVLDFGATLRLQGPKQRHGRRTWEGTTEEALAALAPLAAGVGTLAVWTALRAT